VLLAIDIGNTNISFALFKGSRINKNWDIPTKSYSKLKLLKKLKGKLIRFALICSVVPGIVNKLAGDIHSISGVKPEIIGRDIFVPIKNFYRNKKQLGQDRLVNAYAASQIYSVPVIVVSYGTAVTLDVVSKNRTYLGGLIQPGLRLSLSALNSGAAMLPKLNLLPACGLIGIDTRSSILNGVILGSSGSTDALIERIRLKTGKNTLVIGTGGDISLIKKSSKYIKTVDEDLTLKGIFLVYKNGLKKG